MCAQALSGNLERNTVSAGNLAEQVETVFRPAFRSTSINRDDPVAWRKSGLLRGATGRHRAHNGLEILVSD